jgi:hypothetical protein
MNTSNSKKSKTIQLKKLTAGIEELRKRNAELEKMKVPEEETCTGCITGEPNQLAHMDPGGCLYSPEEYEENDWEEDDSDEEEDDSDGEEESSVGSSKNDASGHVLSSSSR